MIGSRSAKSRILRIATRNSALAMWQAEYVAGRLLAMGVPTTVVPLVSSGDTDMRPLTDVDPRGTTREIGVFTKRIQQALVDDEADVAVHSLKDLPTDADPRFRLVAIPVRETVVDALVTVDGRSLDELPEGGLVGTGSRRRAAQLKHHRPDLRTEPIRGNVQTRLRKLTDEPIDALVLAEAGLLRLGMDDVRRTPLPAQVMLPAPGQGALGIEVRSDDPAAISTVGRLDDRRARASVTAERRLLAALHGGCLAPIAAHGRYDQNRLTLEARVLSADGRVKLEERGETDSIEAPEDLANRLADRLIARGAREIIQGAR